jgi:hypothetical protein
VCGWVLVVVLHYKGGFGCIEARLLCERGVGSRDFESGEQELTSEF